MALVGNPNVGKSTVFNALTGLHQHTGNWPGKTVAVAQGSYAYKGRVYLLVDLPGTYSLQAQSEEERTAAAFLREVPVDCTVVLVDATCLERNLILALQIMAQTERVIVCVNLLDEAERHGCLPDLQKLERLLGVPVVGTAAGAGRGLPQLQEQIRQVSDGFGRCRPLRLQAGEGPIDAAAKIAASVLETPSAPRTELLDRIVLGRWSGRLVLLGLLLAVLWLTVRGANVPSALLAAGFSGLGQWLRQWLAFLPAWLSGLLLDGVYATTTEVVAVMLPPMAIFFPLFSLLEDFGYLPRAAFLMDRSFQRCGGCGKQMLTMAMGFGCNAVGVMGCRIIASPRERLLAMVTNAMVPCNGRLSVMITLITLCFTDHAVAAALLLLGFLLLSTAMTLLATNLLQRTVLRGSGSDFVLELPPYRRPKVGQVLLRAFLDRTVKVLVRAVAVAAPAGGVLWLLQQLQIGQQPLLSRLAAALDPAAVLLGLNGAILLAFILSFPANELLLPLLTVITQAEELSVLTSAGWTWKTALCTVVFLLFHWPCSTTCLTIRKETGSTGWTLMAVLLPTVCGILLCAAVRWLLP